jgi:hypothetical protein
MLQFFVEQRNTLPGRDVALPHVSPYEEAKRPATTS